MRRQARPPRGPGSGFGSAPGAPAPGAPETFAPGAPVARTATAQSVPVRLGWQVADGVLVLTATTPGRGASCDDYWSMSPSLALTSTTVLDTCVPGLTSYVSRAIVAASSLVCDTTYTFSYALVMTTGEGVWVGSSSVAVTVGPDGSLTAPDGSAGHARG